MGNARSAKTQKGSETPYSRQQAHDSSVTRPQNTTSTSSTPGMKAKTAPEGIFNVFVVVTGKTHGAHETVIRNQLEPMGHMQNKSLEESDYILAFCPLPSRSGTDVKEAMGTIPIGKQVILVVMHHRYDVEAYLDDSSRHVTRKDVILTVDTVFWEGEFLNCSHNVKAFNKVLQAVGRSSTTLKPTEKTSTGLASTVDMPTGEKSASPGQLYLADGCCSDRDGLHEEPTSSTSAMTIKQDTKIKPWKDFGNKDKLLNWVKELQPQNKNVKYVRILLHGPVGSGKSSFINSVSSILKGRMTQGAHVDVAGNKSYTIKYQNHKIKRGNKQDFFPFVFNDIVGLGSETGVNEEDVKLALKGHFKDGYTFNPVSAMSHDPLYNRHPTLEDKGHVLVMVIPADKATSTQDSMKKMRDCIAEIKGIPQICILTKIDEASSLVKEDVQNVYKCKNLKEKMEEFSTKVGIPLSDIFPVKNYHVETDLDDDIDVLILTALKRMINLGEDFINRMESDPMSSQ